MVMNKNCNWKDNIFVVNKIQVYTILKGSNIMDGKQKSNGIFLLVFDNTQYRLGYLCVKPKQTKNFTWLYNIFISEPSHV